MGRDIWHLFETSFSSMFKALPLLVVWLLLPLLLFCLLSVCQITMLLDESKTVFHQDKQPFDDSQYGSLELVIRSPQKSIINLKKQSNVPVSFWLFGKPRQPASAPGDLPTYQLMITSPSGNAKFVDANGLPIYPQFTLTPAADATTPILIYVHPTENGQPMKFEASVSDANGQVLNGPDPLTWEIGVESRVASGGRYLLEQILSAGALAGLIGGLVGFTVQQWNRTLDEDKERTAAREKQQKQSEEEKRLRQEKLDELERMLKQNQLSEGARLYMQYRFHETGFWQDAALKEHLQRIWTRHTPRELKRLVELRHKAEEKELSKTKLPADELGEFEEAAVWGYAMLDQDWTQSLTDILQNMLKTVLPAVGLQRLWQAVLNPWPFVHPWSPSRYIDLPALRQAVTLLKNDGRLAHPINPFSTAPAETDALLLASRIDLPVYQQMLEPGPTVIYGGQGAGKTAQALFAMYDCLKLGTISPVYYPDALAASAAPLDGLAKAITFTLLNYWVSLPNSFIEQAPTVKASLAQLLCRYVGRGKQFALYLQQAGFTPVGAGEMMLNTLTDLMADLDSQTAFTQNELLALLAQVRPRQHTCLFVLVDISGDAAEHDFQSAAYRLTSLLALLPALMNVGIYLKLFLPCQLRPHLPPLAPATDVLTLQWTSKELGNLLVKRLEQAGGDEGSLSDLYEEQPLLARLIDRTVEQAQGAPGYLFALGSQILSQVAGHPDEPYITDGDVRAVW